MLRTEAQECRGSCKLSPHLGSRPSAVYRVRGPLRLPASSLSIPPKDRRSWQLGFVQGQKANQPAFHKARNEGRKSSSIGSLPYRGKCPETLCLEEDPPRSPAFSKLISSVRREAFVDQAPAGPTAEPGQEASSAARTLAPRLPPGRASSCQSAEQTQTRGLNTCTCPGTSPFPWKHVSLGSELLSVLRFLFPNRTEAGGRRGKEGSGNHRRRRSGPARPDLPRPARTSLPPSPPSPPLLTPHGLPVRAANLGRPPLNERPRPAPCSPRIRRRPARSRAPRPWLPPRAPRSGRAGSGSWRPGRTAPPARARVLMGSAPAPAGPRPRRRRRRRSENPHPRPRTRPFRPAPGSTSPRGRASSGGGWSERSAVPARWAPRALWQGSWCGVRPHL